jgi:hypothetical protein
MNVDASGVPTPLTHTGSGKRPVGKGMHDKGDGSTGNNGKGMMSIKGTGKGVDRGKENKRKRKSKAREN